MSLSAERSEAYDMIERHLRNTLDDEQYAGYLRALDSLYAVSAQGEPVGVTEVFIDNEAYEWHQPTITGTELRELALIPRNIDVFSKVYGHPDQIFTVSDVAKIDKYTRFCTQARESCAGLDGRPAEKIKRFTLSADNGLMYESDRGAWCLYRDVVPQPADPQTGNWIAADDVLRNVKLLDVALNGPGGATRPLLIDILGQVEGVARRLGKPVLHAITEPGVVDPTERLLSELQNGTAQKDWDAWAKEVEVVLSNTLDDSKPLNRDVPQPAEPVAWMLRKKSNGFTRGVYDHPPRKESLEIAECDGDVYTPLYAAPQPTDKGVSVNIADMGLLPEDDTGNVTFSAGKNALPAPDGTPGGMGGQVYFGEPVVLRLAPEGLYYKGEFVADAGEARRVWIETMRALAKGAV